MADDLKPANTPKKQLPLGPTDVDPSNYRQSVICGCGLWRLLPKGLSEGDEVHLVPCPKCGWAPQLRHLGDCVELIEPQHADGYEGEVHVAPIHKQEIQ